MIEGDPMTIWIVLQGFSEFLIDGLIVGLPSVLPLFFVFSFVSVLFRRETTWLRIRDVRDQEFFNKDLWHRIESAPARWTMKSLFVFISHISVLILQVKTAISNENKWVFSFQHKTMTIPVSNCFHHFTTISNPSHIPPPSVSQFTIGLRPFTLSSSMILRKAPFMYFSTSA